MNNEQWAARCNTAQPIVHCSLFVVNCQSLILRCLVDEFHELVELGRDDDLGAAVALLAHGCVVGGDGVVLTTSTCGETLGIYAVLGLQFLYHAGGTETREVPVVADVGL